MNAPLKVGLAGLGTVGTAVVQLLERGRDKLAARCGRPIEIVAICARSRGKKRDVDLKKFRWFADPVELARDPAIDVLVEVIGGAGDPAKRCRGGRARLRQGGGDRQQGAARPSRPEARGCWRSAAASRSISKLRWAAAFRSSRRCARG